jgi:hypothetical protein
MAALVIAEHDNASIKGATLNTVTAAIACGGDVHLLVAGANAAAAAQAGAGIAGVAKVLHADAPGLDHGLAENVAAQVVAIAQGYSHLLFPATAAGKNVAPRVAALLDVAQISDATRVISADTFERPIYAGNAMATVQSLDAIKVITVRTTGFDAAAASGGSAPVESLGAVADSGLSRFRELRRGLALLAEAGLHQLRRPGRADRDHAHRAGRAPPLDQREALPACAELLHGAARPRGAAARHLHRLADAPQLGRHRRRRAVRAAVAVHPDRAVWIYLRFGDVPLVAGIFYGIKPAVTALVLHAAHRIGTRALKNRWMWGIAAAAFVAIFAFDTPFPAIVLAAALIGHFGARRCAAGVRARRGPWQREGISYGPALIDDDTPTPPHARFSRRHLAQGAGGRASACGLRDGGCCWPRRACRAR